MKTKDDTPTHSVREAKSMARRIVEHHFGTKPKRIEHNASGMSNWVFLVHHSEGDFVVRLSPIPTKINSFIKEQWAVRRAHEVGVPTPDILEVGNEVVPVPYMVSRRVRGRDATHHPDPFPILRQMGRYAALINSIPTTGFGQVFDWSNNQLSRNETWKQYLHSELKLDARLTTLEKERMVSAAKSKEMRSLLERGVKRLPKTALNHGDMRLKNSIVDERGKITAIIDWEHCSSNLTPHWELSLALHDLSIDEKQEFLKGYGLHEKTLAEIAPVMKALNLLNYAPRIEQLVQMNDRVQIEQYRIRLAGVLDLYSL